MSRNARFFPLLVGLVIGCGDDGGTESSSASASTSTATATATASASDSVTDSGSDSVTDSVTDSGSGSDTGSGACVPFDGNDDCPDGSFCLAQTATSGQCTPATTTGTTAEEACDPPLSACGEDLLCQQITGGATICAVMCRLDMGDADCPADRTCIDAYDLPEVGGCAPA
jgi:hypothetical protein